jgi:hypothetical protein
MKDTGAIVNAGAFVWDEIRKATWQLPFSFSSSCPYPCLFLALCLP